MKPSRVRLAVCALLFLGWIGWLVYLSATTSRPVVLSRPQFLAADLYVLAEVHAGPKGPDAPDAEVTVREIVWPGPGMDLAGRPLVIPNLPQSGPKQGWNGPGEYILPLTQKKQKGREVYQVTPIPRSPGYSRHETPIYPANATARRELKDLIAELHPK
jgi:hypothetical protein